jgi:hypothetical protein
MSEKWYHLLEEEFLEDLSGNPMIKFGETPFTERATPAG